MFLHALRRWLSCNVRAHHDDGKTLGNSERWSPEFGGRQRRTPAEPYGNRGVAAVEPLACEVLCLAARIGTEVKAFLDLGCRAIGIDLNPGPENEYVVQGDFHNLQFPPNSMDVVYTNSLDHAFDIDRIAAEVLRVLKPEGVLIIEAVKGRDQGVNPGFFESFFWNNIEELIGLFERAGFTVTLRAPITYPWPGETICFGARR